MRALVAEMIRDVPDERPSIHEVVARFRRISASLNWWTLRRPIDRRIYPAIFRVARMSVVLWRDVRYILFGTSPVPVVHL